MNLEAQLKLQAFLDGELPASEARQVSAWLERDPQAQTLLVELQQVHSLLVTNPVAAKLPVTQDFYWSQIARKIEEQSVRTDEPVSALPQGLRAWWKLLAPLGAAAMLALVLLSSWPSAPTTPQRPAMAALQGIEVETALPSGQVITFRSDMEGISVVWVDIH